MHLVGIGDARCIDRKPASPGEVPRREDPRGSLVYENEAHFNWKSSMNVDPIAPHRLVQPLYLRTTSIIYSECSLDAAMAGKSAFKRASHRRLALRRAAIYGSSRSLEAKPSRPFILRSSRYFKRACKTCPEHTRQVRWLLSLHAAISGSRVA